MGGKHKQAQRTKNNARPSSSGRSAELLGSQAPKFVGFGAAKDGGYVAVLPGFSLGGSDVLDPNISPDFQIVLKKMSKKDATTKLKALQEFAELVGGCKEQEMSVVLPFWPRLYSQLAVDAEHRVREAAHQGQLAVVRCMRRNLAPFLRQLIGPWFTSQYDTYGPAASAATLSFQEAFPPNKVPEVIVFCQNEILNYIYDNIIIQKPQTVYNAQVLSKEELEAKYERLLVSSLHGYALYLDTLQPDKLALARDANKKILSCKKFWKYNKHAGSGVRGAWFRAVVALCRRWPDLLEEEASHVTLAILGSLDEADVVVLPAVWEAALHVLTTLQDCWAQVNVEKLVLPKLWNILREAGHGSAATIFPNLLPLLSRLPDPIPQQDRPHFYCSFFTYMRAGFGQRSVQQSISESNAVAKCYVECVRFALVKYMENKDFCSDIVENHLVAAVELTLSGDCSRVLAEAVHHEVSLVVGWWEQEERYSELRTVFWRALGSCVLGTLRQRQCARTLDYIYLLCCCLQDPSHPRSKQPKHVSFDDEEDIRLLEEPAVNTTPLSAPLQSLLEEMCTACVELVDSGGGGEGSSHLVTHLSRLLARFGCERLVTALSSAAGCHPFTPLQWAKSTVSRWLSLKDCSPQFVIKLAFALLETLPPPDQLPLLQHLAQTQDGSLVVGFLQSVALHHHVPAVASWLAGEGCCSLLVSLAQHTLSPQLSTDARPVMKDILKWMPLGDLPLPVETLENVMRVYWEALSSPWDLLEDVACVGFVCELVHILYGGDLVVSPQLCSSNVCRDLVLLLFDGSCRAEAPYQDLRVDTVSAWSAAVGALSRALCSRSDAFRDLLQRFAAVLRLRLFEILEPEDSAVYVAVDAASSLLLCGARNPLGHVDRAALASLCALLMDAVSCNSGAWRDQAADLCLYALCAAGVLHVPCSYPGLASRSLSAEPGFSRLLVLGLFSASLLVRLCLPEQCHDEGSASDTDTDDDEPFAVQETFIFLNEHILSFLYISVLGSTFSSHYHATWYASTIGRKLEALRSKSRELLEVLRSEVTAVSAAICARASEEGGLWLIVNNELPLNASLRLTCIDGLEHFAIPHLHAVQMYPRLEATARCEELPEFMMEVLDSADVCDATVAVVTSWCEYDGFPGDVKMLQRCAERAHDMALALEEWLRSDRDMATLRWEEVSVAVQTMNFTTSILSKKTASLSEDIKEWLSAFKDTSCNSEAKLPSVLLLLLRSLHAVRTKLLVPSAGLRVPLFHSPSQETQVPAGSPDDCKVQVLAIAALRLVAAVNKRLCEKGRQPSKSWDSGYCEDICTALFQLFLYVAEEGDVSAMTCHDQLLLERLADAIVTFDTAMMFRSWDTTRAVQFSCGLLTSTVPQLQQVGYHFLQSLLKQLVVLDARTLKGCVADAGDEVEMARSLSLWQLRPTLEHTQGVMEALLSDFSLGDCCLVRPHTDSFALARAYLFMWDLLFAMCARADTDLRFHYASQLSKQAYVSSLLQILFRLMPEDVVQLKKSKNLEFLQCVQSRSGIELVGSNLTSECLQDWVCLVYLRALQRLPAVVRQWWAGLDSRASTLVEQVTAHYMSPTLCSLEMDSLQSKNGNMTVHVYGRAREVVARYHVEDVSLELSVVLPSNHPLGPVKVESVNRQPMVEHANWRNWIMQLTVFLAHQNGSLWDGLNLWKNNLDKRFEGIEECYICFSILHGSNFQIPRIRCETCKKKFHPHCMYKWFDTSNKSTCPICRNFIL